MNVTLPSELKEFVREVIGFGMFQTSNEVICAALRRMKKDHDARKPWSPRTRKELEERLAEGIARLDRGEGIDGEEAFKRIRKKIKARLRS